MKKWLGLYIVICLAALGILGGLLGVQAAKQADFGMIQQAGGYHSQVIETKEHAYVLYQNPGEQKFRIAKTDKELNEYETVGTVHQNGVYALFSHTDGNKQYFGIEPLGTAKGEEEWIIPVFEATGTFLAAGSNEKAIFCSILGKDGRTITEYALPFGEKPKWAERQSFSLSNDHFAVSGAYEGDTLWFVQEDGAVFTSGIILREVDTKAEDTILAAALKTHLAEGGESIWRMTSIKDTVLELSLPIILLSAAVVLLFYGNKKRNHMVYRILCCTELLCLVALFYAGCTLASRMTQKEVLETGIEAGYVLEEMKWNQRADGTVKADAYWTAMEKRSGLLEDLIVLEPENGEVLLAKTLPMGVKIDTYYGAEATELATQVAEGNQIMMKRFKQADSRRYAVALRDWADMESDSVMLAVLSEKGLQNSMAATVSALWSVLGGLFVVLTLAHVGIFIFFANRWKKFEEGIAYVATEKKVYPEVPKYHDGLQSVWVPLDEIGHSLSRLYYEKELFYRSYYRFVPKDMEKLMRKPQMADIEIGDRNKIRGCMVHMILEDMKHLDGAEYMAVMTKSLELMHHIREKREGIFLSAATDLQERKIFFEQNARRALQFSVDLLHAHAETGLLAENDLIMMLHVAEFQYGVSGVKDMMTPYMYSAQERILEPYAKSLAKAKVKIVLTEQTMHLLGDGFTTRYIGFISDEEMTGGIKMYECLDAYKETRRKRMLETENAFQKGLQLFYSNDFYLARNTFNDVLKLNEQDRIARWYLFRCEYYLNHPDEEVSYGLFENQ